MPARTSKPTKNRTTTPPADRGLERLQKVLAAAGLGSRRKCEELIVQGRVEVDKQVVSELGAKVNTMTQEVRVDGQVLKKQRAQYFIVNKPEGVVSTNYDQDQRVRVIDLVRSNERLYTIGRLDQFSEGLILVTNDGEMANRLTHPRYGAEKTYVVLVAGELTPETLLKLKKGVYLSEGVARVSSLTIRKAMRHSTELEMVLQEGKNRELRRILAAVGHKVLKLRRVQIGPIKLGNLPVGAHRPLSPDELAKLRDYAFSSRVQKKSKRGPGKGPLTVKKKSPTPRAEATFDEEEESLSDVGPVLVNEELTHFDDRSPVKKDFRSQRAGAVISYDEGDAPAPSPAAEPRESRERVPRPSKQFKPGKKFAKARASKGDRPTFGKHKPAKKKFARAKGRR